MVEFTKNLKFIATFLFVTLLLSMFTSQKFTFNFLVLVFLSMILLNSEKVTTMLGGLQYE